MTTSAALVAKHGLLSVTMSNVAAETGIGRATLYKYFPDVEAILAAWHERQITSHLRCLTDVRDGAREAPRRLKLVLEQYALLAHASHGRHDDALVALLHRDKQVARAQQQVRAMIKALLAAAAHRGEVRDDVAPEELANYCLHALAAARSLSSEAAVRRLVTFTLAGIRSPRRAIRSRPR